MKRKSSRKTPAADEHKPEWQIPIHVGDSSYLWTNRRKDTKHDIWTSLWKRRLTNLADAQEKETGIEE